MTGPHGSLEMALLDRYVFVDCLLVDLFVDSHMSELSLTLEAYGTTDEGRSKGLLSIRCVRLSSLDAKIHPELWTDLEKPYSSDGEDQRANEILAAVVQGEATMRSFDLKTDMLELRVQCAEIEVVFSPA